MAILKAGRPGRSEMSHGKGKEIEPLSDFQSTRSSLPGPIGEHRRDALRDIQANNRSDPTNAAEVLIPDGYYINGNPDMFGPDNPLVQETAHRPVGQIPFPIYRTGVYREA
jgi:hypothetical protein